MDIGHGCEAKTDWKLLLISPAPRSPRTKRASCKRASGKRGPCIVMLGARLMVRVCLTKERGLRVPTAWKMLLWRSFPVTRRLDLLLALLVPALLARFPPRGFLRTFLARETYVCGVCLCPTFSWIFSGDFLLRERLFWAETYPLVLPMEMEKFRRHLLAAAWRRKLQSWAYMDELVLLLRLCAT